MPGSLYFPDQREKWSAENRDDPETGGSGVRVFFLWEEEDARDSAGASPSRKRILRLGGGLALPEEDARGSAGASPSEGEPPRTSFYVEPIIPAFRYFTDQPDSTSVCSVPAGITCR